MANADIAQRLKGIRLLSDVSVREMAQSMGITDKEYKDYEDGNTMIPVSILLDACEILKISMTELLTGETAKLRTYAFVKKGRGVSVERSEEYKYENLAFNFVDRKVQPLLVTVDPDDSKEVHVNSHPGQEFHYCLEGSYIFRIEDKDMVVEEGDSVYFNSIYPHGMKALNEKPAKILVITI